MAEMKVKKSVFVSTIVATGLVFGSIGAFAATGIEKITAYLNHDIKFTVNGQSWTPKDPDGKTLSPIVYEGSSYLPVRAVSEALNAAVDFNSSTQVISINTGSAAGVPYKDDSSYGSGSGAGQPTGGSTGGSTGSTSTPAPTPSSNGIFRLTGTTEQMTQKMKDEAAVVIKLFGEALETGSTKKFDEYMDTHAAENKGSYLPMSSGKQYYKDRFKSLVEATIADNTASTISEYAKALKNVKASEIKVSYVGDKSEFSQSYSYSFTPEGWSAFSSVYVYFDFSVEEYDSDVYLLHRVAIQ